MGSLSQTSMGRVEDYLNDKFQAVADLNNIDSLLQKLNEQQTLLRQQLQDAKLEQARTKAAFEEKLATTTERARRHEQEQSDIARRLRVISQSEVSDDAITKFEQPMQRLKRIELAEGYVKSLQEAQQLATRAEKELPDNPASAVEAYRMLQSLTVALDEAQLATDGATPHLVDAVAKLNTQAYELIKKELEQQFRSTLDALKWPARELQTAGEPLQRWTQHTTLLLKIQEPSLVQKAKHVSESVVPTAPVLLPLAIMVQPLVQRFRYHYYGDRPTNRLDHPEYFLRHTLDLVTTHSPFLSEHLQPILDARTDEDSRLDTVYTDSTSAFISALLPMVSAKCVSVLPQVKTQPQLMSHFVREVINFDNELRQTWGFTPIPNSFSSYDGLTWELLTRHGYFDIWLKLEKDFALSRYQAIIDSSDSRDIEYDGVDVGQTKPTRGALRVNDLLETITDRYRDLRSFSQKMKFLINIQLSIFDRYHAWLNDHLQAYRSSAHTAGRIISGQTADTALGLAGLTSLIKIFGSAEYLEKKMTDWSDDVFFLELWEELQDRAAHNTGTNTTVGHGLSVEEVASKTSSALRNTDEILESDSGALFDETASAYRRLREGSESELMRLLQLNVRGALKPLQNVSIWSSLSTVTTGISQLTPSAALDTFQQVMSPLLELLGRTLAAAPLRRVAKHVCIAVQEEILDRLLLRSNFSLAGALQLQRDLQSICHTINAPIGLAAEAERHLTRLNNALTLLSLPIKASKAIDVGSADDEADGWGFDDEDIANTSDPLPIQDEDWGLWQAEKAIFADNASARDALESMNLTNLTETEARNIIKRRIEINS